MTPSTKAMICLATLMNARLTKAELATKLGVHDRTVKRYLRSIETAGFELKWNFTPHPAGGRQDVRIYWVDQTPPSPLAGQVA